MWNALLVSSLIFQAFAADVNVCVKNSGIHCFVYVTSDSDENAVNTSPVSQGEYTDILISHGANNVITSEFVQENCKIFKLSNVGVYTFNVWPFISLDKPNKLDQLTVPVAFEKSQYTINITDVKGKYNVLFNPILGNNIISGSIHVSSGKIDHNAVLVGAADENNNTFSAKVRENFTFQINNIPKGNYRIFPIKLDTIIHVPKDAKIFCPNYYLKEPHHSCIYTHTYNAGIDRLYKQYKTIRNDISNLYTPIQVDESVSSIGLEILGNLEESTISLVLKCNRRTMYAIELHQYTDDKKKTQNLTRSITHMENVDFHNLKQGEYLIKIWRAPVGVHSNDLMKIKSGFVKDIPVTIKPYSGTIYIGVDFDLLSKGDNIDGYEDEFLFNIFVKSLIDKFGRFPVHFVSWALLIYSLWLYYGNHNDTTVNMKIKLLNYDKRSHKKDNKKRK